MTRWADALDRPTLIVGDFNVAPLECDVYDHKALLKVVSHTPIEVEALDPLRAMRTAGSTSAASSFPRRSATTRGGRTARCWRQKDQGRRLDHMWACPELARRRRSHRLVEETRRWDSPSDHVPLVTEFDL